MEGGWSTAASLWDPIRLQKPSNPLELMGRVELSSRVSSVWASFCLCPSVSADGEGEWPHLQELRLLGDLSCSFRTGSLELEGFLAEVESGCFRVDVLEPHPELRWCLPLPLDHLVLGDYTAVCGIIACGGDCFMALDCLACR